MTPWSWWVGHQHSVEEDGVYDIDECLSRELAVQSGLRETVAGERFYVVEARCSTAKRNWREDDAVLPFARSRNRELLTNGPSTP